MGAKLETLGSSIRVVTSMWVLLMSRTSEDHPREDANRTFRPPGPLSHDRAGGQGPVLCTSCRSDMLLSDCGKLGSFCQWPESHEFGGAAPAVHKPPDFPDGNVTAP